jgi:hypothetical protein
MNNIFTSVEVKDAKGKVVKVRDKNGKLVPLVRYKEGANGTGHTLRFECAFCSTPKNPVRFRSQSERTQHTEFCLK